MTGVIEQLGRLLDSLAVWLVAHDTAAVLTAGGAGIVVGAVRWRIRAQQHARMLRGAVTVTLVPPPRVDPAGAVVFWSNLLGLLRPALLRGRRGQPHLVFEYGFTPHGVAVSVWVPGGVAAGLVARAVTAAWPGSRTTLTPTPATPRPPRLRLRLRWAGSATSPSEVVAGGQLRLARGAALPLDTTATGVDPIRALLAAPGALRAGEWVRVQVLARPVSSARLARTARTGLRRRGGRLVGAITAAVRAVLREVLDVAMPGPRPRTSRPVSGYGFWPPRARMLEIAQDRAAVAKARGGGYETLIRYATATTRTPPFAPVEGISPPPLEQTGAPPLTIDGTADAGAAEDPTPDAETDPARAVVAGRAHAVASAFAAFSGHNHYRRRHLRRPATALTTRRLRHGDVLSVPELAALAHLPVDEHVPGLLRAGAAAVAPPPQTPTPGPGVKPLGDSDATPGRPVGVTVADARHHLQIIGATGSGKSTLMTHLVCDDAAAGRGALVIDPKGDLVVDITTHLPTRARRRVILIDPDHPLSAGHSGMAPGGGPVWQCLNPLAPHPSDRGMAASSGVGDGAVENVVTVFSRLFAASWGFRTDDLLRVACLTLRAGPETPSLAQIPELLTNPHALARATTHLRRSTGSPGLVNQELARYWRWFASLSDPARAQVTAPLLNKLRALLLRPFARQLLCGGPSTINLTTVLDRGGLLLVRIPKGVLGEETTRLVGSLILAQTWQAATARAHRPQEERPDASIVIDECHNFLNLPYRIEDMLAEARGFRVGLTLAHQNLAQLPAELREGINTNARNKIMFSVSPDDATHLARHTLPELNAHDLAHLDAFHAAARLLHHGAETRAFTLTTRPLPPLRPRPRSPRSRTDTSGQCDPTSHSRAHNLHGTRWP